MKTVYPNQVMDNYLKTEIKSTMTTMEKVKKLADIAQRDFDYIYGRPNWQDYIIYGGGTCYASAFFIAEGCTRLGITAGTHPEKWTASDHRNAAVLIDGKLYAFEAGYQGARPRTYTYWELPDYFSTDTTTRSDGTDGVILIRYDLPFVEDDPEVNEVIPVPRTVNGLPVTGIGHPSGWYCAIFSFQNTRTINLPDTVEYIYPDAFQGDAALTNFTLPNSVLTIGERAIWGCSGLGSLVIPPKVTSLPSQTFYNCGKLTLTVPASVTSIADDCFTNTDITLVVDRLSYAATYAKSHNIPYRLFDKNILYLPAGVKCVDASAFEGTAAACVVVPDGCKTIASEAFAGCSQLKWVEIPASVTSIADNAFGSLQGFTIIAPQGSAAASFASQHGLTLVNP